MIHLAGQTSRQNCGERQKARIPLNQSIAAARPLSSFSEEPPLNPLSLTGTQIPASVSVTSKTPPPAANASLSSGPVRKKKIVTNVLLCLINGERIPVEAF